MTRKAYIEKRVRDACPELDLTDPDSILLEHIIRALPKTHRFVIAPKKEGRSSVIGLEVLRPNWLISTPIWSDQLISFQYDHTRPFSQHPDDTYLCLALSLDKNFP